MSPHPQPPTTRTERHHHILDDLIDMAHTLARQLHAQATQPTPDSSTASPTPARITPAADHALYATAFDRLARTIRRTILLSRKLDEPPQLPHAPRPTLPRTALPRPTPPRLDIDPARLTDRELDEHADELDRVDDLAALPLAQAVAQLRRELGLPELPPDPPAPTPQHGHAGGPQAPNHLHADGANPGLARPPHTHPNLTRPPTIPQWPPPPTP